VGRLAAGLAARARAYEAAAERAEGELREALDQLARAKDAEALDLAPLARALGASVSPDVPPPPSGAPPAWGVILGEAFQGERELEATARELASLAPDSASKALAARLAVATARGAGKVRKLYLRYT
jgi:hypothetical protein